MVNKRKDGEEALKEILLRMSYDLGKTLNENKELLNEHVFNDEWKGKDPTASLTKKSDVDGVSSAASLTPNDNKISVRQRGKRPDRFAKIRGPYQQYLKTGIIPEPQQSGTSNYSGYQIEWGPDQYRFSYEPSIEDKREKALPIEEFAKIYDAKLKQAGRLKNDFDELKKAGFDITYDEYLNLIEKLTPPDKTEPTKLKSIEEFAWENYDYSINGYTDNPFDWSNLQIRNLQIPPVQDQIYNQIPAVDKQRMIDSNNAAEKEKKEKGHNFYPENEKEREIVKAYNDYLKENGYFKPKMNINLNKGPLPNQTYYSYTRAGDSKPTSYSTYFEAQRAYSQDYNTWYYNFGQFEENAVESENSGLHDFLMIAGLTLALVSAFASFGTTTPISVGGLTLSGLAATASLAFNVADAGLYGYEENYRMAVFVALLSLFDVAQILKAVKGLKVAQTEINQIREKALEMLYGRRLMSPGQQSDITKLFTKRELQIAYSIDRAYLTGEAKLLGSQVFKESAKRILELAKVGAPELIASLTKLKTYINLGKLFLTIDGIQWSYNNLVNAIYGPDEYHKSLTEMLIIHMFKNNSIQSQIQSNNAEIESTLNQKLSEKLKTEFMAGVSGIDSGVKKTSEGSLDDVTKRLTQTLKNAEIKYNNLNDNEKLILPGTVTHYYRLNNKPVPFKTKEEGNKFREWFNNEFPYLSKEIRLDRTGSFDNSYIKRAYNIPIEGVGIVGDIYNEEIMNTDNNTENKTSPYFD